MSKRKSKKQRRFEKRMGITSKMRDELVNVSFNRTPARTIMNFFREINAQIFNRRRNRESDRNR